MEPLAFSHVKQTKKNSVNTCASWRPHSLRRMKCLNRLLCIYVYYKFRYIYVMYIQYVFMFYVSVLWRICVHELPICVYLERFGANLFYVLDFNLKRSMYDYKLYVSLLIFVYSLMDSDERASLQKKMF